MSTVRVRLALAFSAGNITKAATPSFASPARFQNPGQAYLRYNVVWKPEEWIPKYRPREAGGMDAQVQKKGFAEKPEELVHAAEKFERDGYTDCGPGGVSAAMNARCPKDTEGAPEREREREREREMGDGEEAKKF
jgi:hypothetical protein